MLSGVDIGIGNEYNGSEYSNSVKFDLDGVFYFVEEDPIDGYRSAAKEITISQIPANNKFEPTEVFCLMRAENEYHENDVLEIYDVKTSLLVLAVGTGNTDDYYPYWVCEYHPENFHFNLNK